MFLARILSCVVFCLGVTVTDILLRSEDWTKALISAAACGWALAGILDLHFGDDR